MKAFSHTETKLYHTDRPETGKKDTAVPLAAVTFCIAAGILSLGLGVVPKIIIVFNMGFGGSVAMIALQQALSSIVPGIIPVVCGIVLLKTDVSKRAFPVAALVLFGNVFSSLITLLPVFYYGMDVSGIETMSLTYAVFFFFALGVHICSGVLLLLRKRNVTVAIPAFAFVVLRTVTLIGGFANYAATVNIIAYGFTCAAFLSVGLAALGTVGVVPSLGGFAEKLCKVWYLPSIVYTAGQIIAGTIDKGLPGLKSATEAISLTSVLLVLYVIYLRQLKKIDPEMNDETCAEP